MRLSIFGYVIHITKDPAKPHKTVDCAPIEQVTHPDIVVPGDELKRVVEKELADYAMGLCPRCQRADFVEIDGDVRCPMCGLTYHVKEHCDHQWIHSGDVNICTKCLTKEVD